MKKIVGSMLLLFFVANITAKVKLPSVISDNMVLQQNTNVKLWGKSEENVKISITTGWNNKTYTTNADNKGNWLLSVDTPTAGGPYEISVNDGEELVLRNILIGEVWFCSGQSNMEMPMRGFENQPVSGANDVIAKAKSQTPIRMYTTDSKDGEWVRQYSKIPQEDCKGEWLENTSENVANISATAYYFARYIQDVLDVPVGIIISSWGGSAVEAWMSRDILSKFPQVDISILDNDKIIEKPNYTPSALYNAKIAPLTNYTIKGFLWYQGESNRYNADLYEKLMPAFVSDLRFKWDIGEFPFYFVQIAPYKYSGDNNMSAVRLREVQQQNMQDIPNSGMVTTLDIGDSICIHPANKEIVGNRLAYWALAHTYKKTGFGYIPPTYKSLEIIDNKIFVDFNNAEYGLAPLNKQLDGFEIAGTDQIFYPAKATIDGKIKKVVVQNENVLKPIAVRYAYKDYVEASIFNVFGIPLAPFKTDNW
ncbi:sialate O-acetylesterase [Dysgonomonas sp. 520]|uniref:sialate O-acetylesterase n=1 Tax=Dysgonomonas sp. 520 TaxID=2302931 RepID=UPI0013CFE1B8|nr:sialate O-acetylesterase [Dysgonomonas sp. 520]NDW11151.1 sialate O-acetylesterase [Dysgonomonas sp. 520]